MQRSLLAVGVFRPESLPSSKAVFSTDCIGMSLGGSVLLHSESAGVTAAPHTPHVSPWGQRTAVHSCTRAAPKRSPAVRDQRSPCWHRPALARPLSTCLCQETWKWRWKGLQLAVPPTPALRRAGHQACEGRGLCCTRPHQGEGLSAAHGPMTGAGWGSLSLPPLREPRPPEVTCGGGACWRAVLGGQVAPQGMAMVGWPGCDITKPRCATP